MGLFKSGWGDNLGQIISYAASKTTPVDADSIGLSDSADSGLLKKLTWANLKATLIATAMTWTGKQTFDGGAAIKGSTSAVDAGYVGEIIETSSGATTMPASNTAKTLTSVSLTPGRWRLTAIVFMDSATFSATRLQTVLTAGTTLVGNTTESRYSEGSATLSGGYCIAIIPSYVVTISSTETMNLVMTAFYTGSPSGSPLSGRISAERIA